MSGAQAYGGRDGEGLERLERRVRDKKAAVDRYLVTTCRDRGRLVQVTIIGGSVAAALTAAPALGGKSVSDWLNASFELGAVPAWQLLCLGATICSLAATIATQLHKSNNYDEHIARAREVRAALEALDAGITSHHLSRKQAIAQYMKCIENASFIEAAEHTERRFVLRKTLR